MTYKKISFIIYNNYLLTSKKVQLFSRDKLEMFYFPSEARKIIKREFLEVKNVTIYRLIQGGSGKKLRRVCWNFWQDPFWYPPCNFFPNFTIFFPILGDTHPIFSVFNHFFSILQYTHPIPLHFYKQKQKCTPKIYLRNQT